ncbi:MAG: TetR/AcrR family transcriptional regulator [Nitriliruptor sp.]|nr:MAG: TetR/AcrR family transcriptional regulator [Nitriliruptor sp.]
MGSTVPSSRGEMPDLTARARIRDAAIARFAAVGVAATSIRAIAAEAGVSAGLVIHHFGSKDALRVACDQYVAAVIRDRKQRAAATGAGLDPVAALRDAGDGPPLLRYLARTLVDGSPHVAELVDELVEDAVGYLEEGVATGLITPGDDPRGRAVVLTLWSLGSLVLHDHVNRILGTDLTGDPAELGGWAVPATEILAKGVLPVELYERVRDAFEIGMQGEAQPQQEVIER